MRERTAQLIAYRPIAGIDICKTFCPIDRLKATFRSQILCCGHYYSIAILLNFYGALNAAHECAPGLDSS
jgi:hypothetical protein